MKMVCCSIFGCGNNHRNKELTFFRFPKNENLMKQWTLACRREDHLNMKTARICSVHFQESDHYRSLQHELLGYTPRSCRKLKVDAVPTLHLPGKSEQDHSNILKKDGRTNRLAKRNRHKLVTEMLATSNTTSEMLAVKVKEAEDISTQVAEADKPPCNESLDVIKQPNEEIILITYDDADTTAQNAKDQLIRALLNENRALKAELGSLRKHLKQINTDRKEHVKECLLKKHIFTENQIKCLLQDHRKRIQWTDEDIAAAKTLRNISAEAYQYLRNSLNFPLPSIGTLNRCKTDHSGITEEEMANGDEKSNELGQIVIEM